MKLVTFEGLDGTPVAVNADEVRFALSYDGKTTSISFAKEHGLTVKGSLDEVLLKLRS